MTRRKPRKNTTEEDRFVQDLERTSVFDLVDRGHAHILSPEEYPEPVKRFLSRHSLTKRRTVDLSGGVGNGRRRPVGRSPSNSIVTRAALDRMGIEELAALIDEVRNVARRKLDELSRVI